ncbi:MAG: energy-coupling factor transporter ATPase [Clostridia bacterium]|nr:energy-coupling factor transporter ATPase [Clostridia bacterium]MBQ2092709.1 energy-coupling factor transporter ATPase [Clostridia bacterium]
MSILKTDNLTYKYSVGTPFEVTALDSVNLEVEKGELVAVIGHTGSGKSTLIQHFNGLLKPTEGSVLVDGQDIWESKKTLRDARFKVGLCFQYPEYQLFEETVFADIAFGPKNMKLPEEEIKERVLRAAEFTGVTKEMLEKSPFDLSGGEKRRVAIAGVMAMEPEILILDEPTSGLDPKGRDTILRLIRDYRDNTGSTVMIVSHSMEDVAKIATKVLVMNRATVMSYDTVPETYRHAEELLSVGLDVPQITKIFMDLKRRGLPVRDDVYTVEQAVAEIDRLRKEGVNV